MPKSNTLPERPSDIPDTDIKDLHDQLFAATQLSADLHECSVSLLYFINRFPDQQTANMLFPLTAILLYRQARDIMDVLQ